MELGGEQTACLTAKFISQVKVTPHSYPSIKGQKCWGFLFTRPMEQMKVGKQVFLAANVDTSIIAGTSFTRG